MIKNSMKSFDFIVLGGDLSLQNARFHGAASFVNPHVIRVIAAVGMGK